MNPENKTQIQANRRKIFELEVLVNQNKTKVEVCRASIEQNYASIMRNYNAAYMGNHHLANQEYRLTYSFSSHKHLHHVNKNLHVPYRMIDWIRSRLILFHYIFFS